MPFEKIFQDIQESLKKNLKSAKEGKDKIEFYLDEDGQYNRTDKVTGYGATVVCQAWIESPEANYSLTIESNGNDKDKYHWDELQCGENNKVQFDIHTKKIGSTEVKIDIKADVTDTSGTAMLEYEPKLT